MRHLDDFCATLAQGSMISEDLLSREFAGVARNKVRWGDQRQPAGRPDRLRNGVQRGGTGQDRQGVRRVRRALGPSRRRADHWRVECRPSRRRRLMQVSCLEIPGLRLVGEPSG
jgi:hypothetical protein